MSQSQVTPLSKYWGYASVKKLPPIPSTIKPTPFENESGSDVQAVVIAGLNLIGEQGLICPTVSIIRLDQNSGEISGWSLCLGNTESQPDGPYYFRTSEEKGTGTARGTEIPNTMVYFQAEVDVKLASSEADPQKLDELIAYVLPYISDEGPPPADGKSFEELMAETPTSSAEHKAALILKEKVGLLFDCAEQELTGVWDYWKLFEELNRRLHESGLMHAWKSHPSDLNYNPNLGVVEKVVAGWRVTASIGLSKDRFAGPCAVIQIVDNS